MSTTTNHTTCFYIVIVLLQLAISTSIKPSWFMPVSLSECICTTTKWLYVWSGIEDVVCVIIVYVNAQFVAPSLPLKSFAFSVVAALSWSSVYVLQLSSYRFPLLKFFCLSEFIMFTFIDMFKSPILLLYSTAMVWTLQETTTFVVRDGRMYLMTHCEVK